MVKVNFESGESVLIGGRITANDFHDIIREIPQKKKKKTPFVCCGTFTINLNKVTYIETIEEAERS